MGLDWLLLRIILCILRELVTLTYDTMHVLSNYK